MTITIKEVSQRLAYYNEWRRGGDGEQPNPTQLGYDLDYAVKALNVLQKIASGEDIPLDVCEHFYKDFENVGGKSLPKMIGEIIMMLLEKEIKG